ncbi:MAG: hydantoinase B/oxoprolinase family protein [Candidatus Latescibacterota bacterium]|nr:MAG: hydantoinase B/oxoprolinase family protein [Candidatus Latescibacterota bacterium]
MINSDSWQIWVDTGGTFTDCLALDPGGTLHRQKVLSNGGLRGTIERVVDPHQVRVRTAWDVPSGFIDGYEFHLLETTHSRIAVTDYARKHAAITLDAPLPPDASDGSGFEIRSGEEAPILATRLITGAAPGDKLPSISMRLASTRGTNALLERRGAAVALFVTRGFRDLLQIGNQQRPELFALDIRKPDPFYQTVIEVDERIGADGAVIVPLQLPRLTEKVSQLIAQGVRCAAVTLMHSYLNPFHERELAEYLQNAGFEHVSCSSDLAPFIKILPRAETAVVDAYLAPVIGDYLSKVQAPLGDQRLHVMTSAGGLMQPRSYHAKDSLLSGPAGGVVGAAAAGRRSGFQRVIAFDMGGTSTDVARFDDDFDYVFEHEVGDAHLVAPALAVESVAAGGGSICSFDGEELRVGPQSAGADPGPACYGAGGPLTLTDVNLLLGRIDGNRFDIPISPHAAGDAFERLRRLIEKQNKTTIERESLLDGLRDIANERMADAIRRISIRKGYDPKDYALVAFGGAGGQHACAVAGHLGIDTIVIPEDASLLSAMGLGEATIERFAERQVLESLDQAGPHLSKWIGELSGEAAAAIEHEGVPKDQTCIRRIIVNLRFSGQESSVSIDYDQAVPIEQSFESKYKTIFGYYPKGRPIEIESLRVVASSLRSADHSTPHRADKKKLTSRRESKAWFDGGWQKITVFERDDLPPGCWFDGPALVFERFSATAVEAGWTAEIDPRHALIMRRKQTTAANEIDRSDLIQLELFTNRFTAIAREMGEMLRRTALSTNVKERLDFSCAVLDPDGQLVVNAPHIPVHLGAIGMCVRGIRDALPVEPGDVLVTNHPGYGGSHLPDVTVVTPVHLPDGRLLGYVANRAHHAEIGGVRPGSMPPTATTLAEEGVVLPPTHLFKRGTPRWNSVEQMLEGAPYPSRAVDENLADLRAAVAANRGGAEALSKLAADHGEDTVWRYMSALERRAESKIRTALEKVPDGTYEAIELLDDGSPLHAAVTIRGNRAHVDFAGSAGVSPANLNATPAVVMSAVIYVLRLLVDEPLPLNEGLIRAVTVDIPRGLLNPRFSVDPSNAPAVVGGNVETSQRIVDCLIKALGLAACSQGTMNNLTFGTGEYSYYETVCGGAGAGPGFDGASAVHTHMTNTRITDPEIIENRYPVRVDRFEIRRGSGGDGKYRGGDGAIREITFLDAMSLSVLGQHRNTGPYGLAGGASGQPAVQQIVGENGQVTVLDSIDGCDVNPGDRFFLATPGGGGYGSKQPDTD